MSETTQDLLAKAYEMQRTDAALAMVRERDYWERRALQAEAQLLTATPPTPDRAAVREGLINAIEALRVTVHRAPSEEFAMLWRNVHRAIDALLRPAPLPADVQAVVDELRGFLSTRTQLQDGETIGHSFTEHCQYDLTHGMLRTLLAHLQRTEG